MFLTELKNFSRDNWWIYILFIIALSVVYITGKGNIVELIALFFANFVGNLLIMIMQSNYTMKKFKIGALCHISAVTTFTIIAMYGFFMNDQSQYLLWQVTYIGAALKAFTYYNFKKDLSILNEKTFIFINIILYVLFMKYFQFETFHLIQALGFSLITTGLVSIKDNIRYWLNVIGIFLLSGGSLLGVVTSYMSGNIDGIALGYFILTLTVFVYYIKLLPKYLKK
ncbi:hypothetical protein N8455_00510 [Candidatus Gracilibacteria bacterium]|nr:hypothetical protein [Candidatus Gracilibacteria bacterium]